MYYKTHDALQKLRENYIKSLREKIRPSTTQRVQYDYVEQRTINVDRSFTSRSFLYGN